MLRMAEWTNRAAPSPDRIVERLYRSSTICLWVPCKVRKIYPCWLSVLDAAKVKLNRAVTLLQFSYHKQLSSPLGGSCHLLRFNQVSKSTSETNKRQLFSTMCFSSIRESKEILWTLQNTVYKMLKRSLPVY